MRTLRERNASRAAADALVLNPIDHIIEYVLEQGCAWTPALRPKGTRRGKPGRCFNNAISLIGRRADLQYVEGYALSPDFGGVCHAWCVDAADRVVDPTWDPPGLAYFGVMFDRDAVLRAADSHQRTGDSFLLWHVVHGPIERRVNRQRSYVEGA